mmetsp:Transcript_44233/g.90273  ORF Transcript_44233/g.90273 Transcript_44233/m.90273 type:complete len:270 (+) Transcript_44233:489-1298(+)
MGQSVTWAQLVHRRSRLLVLALAVPTPPDVHVAVVGRVEKHLLLWVEVVVLCEQLLKLVLPLFERLLHRVRGVFTFAAPHGLDEEEDVLARYRVERPVELRHVGKVVVEGVGGEREEAAMCEDGHDGEDVEDGLPGADVLGALVHGPLARREDRVRVPPQVEKVADEGDEGDEREDGAEEHHVAELDNLFCVQLVKVLEFVQDVLALNGPLEVSDFFLLLVRMLFYLCAIPPGLDFRPDNGEEVTEDHILEEDDCAHQLRVVDALALAA